jgi:hypothetical protein
MGSLYLVSEARALYRADAAECCRSDTSMDVDHLGTLNELDVWKVDFTRVTQFSLDGR